MALSEVIIEKIKELPGDSLPSVLKFIKFPEERSENREELTNKSIEINPLVKSLSGIVREDEEFDYREEYRNYLIKNII